MLLPTCVPGSAWDATAARLCLAVPRAASLTAQAVRSQAEPETEVPVLLDERKQRADFLVARPPAVLANLERFRVADGRRLLLAVPFFQGGAILLRHCLAALGESVAHLALAFSLLRGILRQQIRGAEGAAFVELRHQRVDGVELLLDHAVERHRDVGSERIGPL